MNTTPLEAAIKQYYWKPMAALFRSLEMRLYCDSSLVFQKPILDLGCGDAGVAQMLMELNVIEELFCGVEISSLELEKAHHANLHLNLLQADGNKLPFKNGSFSTIICNGVLCSIPNGVESVLSEINRVLSSDGVFIATVPTDKFIEVLFFPKFLKHLSPSLSAYYVSSLNNRLPHYTVYSPQAWIQSFESQGLKVVNKTSFFSPKAGFLWNILTMNIIRIFGLLKVIGKKRGFKSIASMYRKIFFNIYANDANQKSDYGYLFLIAKKTPNSLNKLLNRQVYK
jgi:SAM-dependent methyltransferase